MDVVTHCVPRRARVSLKSAEGTASQVRHSGDLTDRNREWRHGTGRIAAPSGGKNPARWAKFRLSRRVPPAIRPSRHCPQWHLDCLIQGMTRHTRHHVSARPAPMLRWALQRHKAAITYQLDACGRRSYEVSIAPHRDPSASLIEHDDAPTPALLHHAAVARLARGRVDGHRRRRGAYSGGGATGRPRSRLGRADCRDRGAP